MNVKEIEIGDMALCDGQWFSVDEIQGNDVVLVDNDGGEQTVDASEIEFTER